MSRAKSKSVGLRLSPTGLQSFFTNSCPAAWNYGREWEPKVSSWSEVAERGTLVHSMLEGKVKPAKVKDAQAVRFYEKLASTVEMLGLQVIHKELYQRFDLVNGVQWARKIDALARTSSGEIVIVDYKTGAAWKSLLDTDITPRSLTFQGIGYTIPPPANQLPVEIVEWPETVLFLVASYRGEVATIRYDYEEKDLDNLLQAVQLVRAAHENNTLPKVRDGHCVECDFNAMCYNLKGWRKSYRRRK